jgi:hypothetical protein
MDMLFKQAIKYYASQIKTLTKVVGKCQVYCTTLLKDSSLDRLWEVLEYLGLITPHSYHRLQSCYGRQQNILQIQQGEIFQKEFMLIASIPSHGEYHYLEALLNVLCFHWMDTSKAKKSLPKFLKPFDKQAEAGSCFWLAIET